MKFPNDIVLNYNQADPVNFASSPNEMWQSQPPTHDDGQRFPECHNSTCEGLLQSQPLMPRSSQQLYQWPDLQSQPVMPRSSQQFYQSHNLPDMQFSEPFGLPNEYFSEIRNRQAYGEPKLPLKHFKTGNSICLDNGLPQLEVFSSPSQIVTHEIERPPQFLLQRDETPVYRTSENDLEDLSSILQESERYRKRQWHGVADNSEIAVFSSVSQIFVPELPQSQQCDKTPVSRTPDKMESNFEMTAMVQEPKNTSKTGNGVAENSESSVFKNAPALIEETVVSYKQEVEYSCISKMRNGFVGNSQGFTTVSVPMFSEEHIAGCMENNVQVRTETDQATLETKGDFNAPEHTSITGGINGVTDNFQGLGSEGVPVIAEGGCMEEVMQYMAVPDQARSEVKDPVVLGADQARSEVKDSVVLGAVFDPEVNSEKPYTPGLCLTQSFTVEQLKEHISSLRQSSCQGIIPEVPGDTTEHSIGKDSCRSCGVDKLFFAPEPKSCFSCNALIKHNTLYYCGVDELGTRHCFCSPCFRLSRSTISVHGISISKKNLQKEKNCAADEEPWVQCDKCQLWDHQICALYNDKRDCEGKAYYICPRCWLQEIEDGNRKPLPSSAFFEAKNLRSSMLSDHLEKRLFRSLKQEREERAKALGKDLDEVPEAEDLVVRLVSSVDKQLKVNQQLLDFAQFENFPNDFPYKSKVILLFQKIEGVDVCLFAMYVQEYGADCSGPNNRAVYISYIDSVKYFRPDVRTATGEALRTVVYHELLIGYLDFCKKRGFATFYLWSCSPIKGDDYILYCHPKSQQTPNSVKLRNWYKSMLKKAASESIVVDITNLYDRFFVPRGQCNAKITAARLPQFDGDYWSSVVERIIKKVESNKSGSRGKGVARRNLKDMGHTNGSATNDILLMKNLGQELSQVKEDFFVIPLHFVCTRCDEIILSGNRWVCNQCSKFQLCARCHQINDDDNSHTCKTGKRHLLAQVSVDDMPFDTEDKDIGLDNSIFDCRDTFLSFCVQNHYQFDTLRHAKHSSMMILYNLHKSFSRSVKNTCSICHSDVVIKQPHHDEICPEVYVCSACYQRRRDGSCDDSTRANCGLSDKQTPQQDERNLREMLDLLVHANECPANQPKLCKYPHCFALKKVFRHTHGCKKRVNGGCRLCQKTWQLLCHHSQECTNSSCTIPRCMDMKKCAETRASQLKTP